MAEIKLPSAPKMENFQTKEEKDVEKVVGKVIDGEIIVKKRSIAGRIRDIFLADDVENVKEYAFSEVIVPGIKNLIVNSIAMLVLGEVYDDSSRRSKRRREKFSYATKYKYDDDDDRRPSRRDRNSDEDTPDYDDIVFKKLSDAERVLYDMYDILKEYDYVSLKDYYSLSGYRSSVFDDSWGWTSLKGVRVKGQRGGYILTLSKPKPLD